MIQKRLKNRKQIKGRRPKIQKQHPFSIIFTYTKLKHSRSKSVRGTCSMAMQRAVHFDRVLRYRIGKLCGNYYIIRRIFAQEQDDKVASIVILLLFACAL